MEEKRNEIATTSSEPIVEFRLLGTFQVKLHQRVISGFRSDKARALLAYLVIESGVRHRRDALASLLWGEFDDRAARRSLSSALANLRQLLTPAALIEIEGLAIESDRSDVVFEVDPDRVEVDAVSFSRLIEACEAHIHRSFVHCDACIARLTQAVELYRGDFLAGLVLSDSPAFDDWRRQLEATYHQRAVDALWILTEHHLATGGFRRAEELARRQLVLIPWSEPAYRQLMMALAALGQRTVALNQYEQCRLVLARELQIEPEPLTTRLADQIRSGSDAFLEALGGVSLENPYKGLQSFQEEDAADFFGREHLTHQLVTKITQGSLVALVGPSGNGKTSLVQAGLVHHLRRGGRAPAFTIQGRPSWPDGSAGAWLIAEMRPGSRPIDALAASLTPLLVNRRPNAWRMDLSETEVAQSLRDGNVSLGHLVDELTGGEVRPASRLLLIVDQFEELFTLCREPELRAQFADILLSALTPHGSAERLAVLLIIRADFMGQVLSLRELADAMQDGTIVLGPMNQVELEQAIVLPARALGVRFQEGLVGRVLGDVGQAPGRLPLLEFALTQLWNQQAEGMLTHRAYESAGRVEGSLARYAEEVYAALDPEEQIQAQRVFTALVQPGKDTEDTRRPVDRAELGEAQWALAQKLAGTRLIVTNRDANGQETAEIVHEALIQAWDRLRQWMDADRAFQLWQQRMRSAVGQWEQSGWDSGALLRGATLAEAEDWTTTRTDDIGVPVREFVSASRDQRDQEQTVLVAAQRRELDQAQALAQAEHLRAETEIRSRKRLRWLAIGLSLVSVAALLAGMLAVSQTWQAQRQANLAEQAEASAQTERGVAQNQARKALSRQLAAQAITYSANQPDLSMLLSREAMQLSDDPDDRKDFLVNLEINPLLASFLQGQEGAVYSVAVSPDGKWVATGNDTGGIRVWNLATRQPAGETMVGLEKEVRALAFSPDGETLAAGDSTGSMRLWNTRTQLPRGQPIKAHDKSILGLGFSPDGKTVRTVGEDATSRLWRVDTGQALDKPLPLLGEAGMALSNDLGLVASKSGVTITLQSTVDGQAVGQPMIGHLEAIHDIAFSPDGRVMASSSFDKSSILWDVASGQKLHPPLSNGNARALVSAFSPDGALLATGGTDGKIYLWDISTGESIVPPLEGNSNWIRALAFTPDGNTLIAGSADGALMLWDVSRHGRISGHQGPVRGLAYSRDGRLLASGSFDKTARVWDAKTRRPLTPPLVGHENAVADVDLNPEGTLLATGSIGGMVTLFDARTGNQLHPQQKVHDKGILVVCFSPDGSKLASAGFGGEIRLSDAASGEPLETVMTGHENWVLGLAFSPDGKTLASSSVDTTIRLWDVATGRPIGDPLEGHTNWVGGLAFSPDGRTLVSGSHDETLRFWDVATGQPIGEPLTGHKAPVWYVAFDPSDGGKTLVSVDGNGTMLRWDAATRQPFGPPMDTGTETEGVALSPDGKTLAIGAFDTSGTINLWNIDTAEWAERVCVTANRSLTAGEWKQFMGEVPYEAGCPKPSDS
jgi:WD40 repeat protein/DNA-binding SARP family transcriptional activator